MRILPWLVVLLAGIADVRVEPRTFAAGRPMELAPFSLQAIEWQVE